MSEKEKIAEIITQAIDRHGGKKSEISRKIGISSQLLGQYAHGKEPGMTFYIRWKREFGEDLFREIETKVYNLPENSTSFNSESFVETSLVSLLEGQNEIRAQIRTIHQWDEQIFAEGDAEKEKQAAEHISKLYAANLLEYQKKGIRPLFASKK